MNKTVNLYQNNEKYVTIYRKNIFLLVTIILIIVIGCGLFLLINSPLIYGIVNTVWLLLGFNFSYIFFYSKVKNVKKVIDLYNTMDFGFKDIVELTYTGNSQQILINDINFVEYVFVNQLMEEVKLYIYIKNTSEFIKDRKYQITCVNEYIYSYVLI